MNATERREEIRGMNKADDDHRRRINEGRIVFFSEKNFL
jgi:hypothetical protein